jgi:hypothetical protein
LANIEQNSTEHYEDAMSRESALQLGEILITIELGKVVTVDQKTTSYKRHKPLKWKPPRIALVDEPVAEKKKVSRLGRATESLSADLALRS